MTPAQLDLARRLVAAPWWEWRPGMLASWYRRSPTDGSVWTSGVTLPDLTDAATAGVLLAWLAEVATCGTDVDPDGRWTVEAWCSREGGQDVAGYGACLGEAVAVALLEVRGV